MTGQMLREPSTAPCTEVGNPVARCAAKPASLDALSRRKNRSAGQAAPARGLSGRLDEPDAHRLADSVHTVVDVQLPVDVADVFTVRSEMTSWLAICLEVRPSASRARISRSRPVSR